MSSQEKIETISINGVDNEILIRAQEMLNVAAKYIRDHCPEAAIEYDGTMCDGYCVADDCENAANDLTQ